ncbi:MAG TPA: hypothetical protein VFO84_02470 [Dehalococcoidia bacterium]|nr:hypothetical protein [Dehalococcoidia bacterium]
MNDSKMTGGEVATGSTGPRLSVRAVVATAIVGVGIAVGVLFATGAFDDDSGSGASTNTVTTSTVDTAGSPGAISEIELRSIELKQVFQEQPAVVAVSPATVEGKLAQLDAAANEAFCQSCFDQWKADQAAQERADQRMADKLAQMDAYDATFGLR